MTDWRSLPARVFVVGEKDPNLRMNYERKSQSWLHFKSLIDIDMNSGESNIRINHKSKRGIRAYYIGIGGLSFKPTVPFTAPSAVSTTKTLTADSPHNAVRISSQHILLLIRDLRDKLLKSPDFKLCVSGLQQRKPKTEMIRQPGAQEAFVIELADLNSDEVASLLLHHSSLGKISSMAVQVGMLVLNKDEQIAFSDILLLNMGLLMVDRYASYVLQAMSLIDENFAMQLSTYCQENFTLLVKDEFASRVMQNLAERSDKFRDYCFRSLESNPCIFQTDIPAVFLASTCIRNAKSQAEFFFFGDMIQNYPNFLTSRYSKRIIVSYIENCTEEELDITFYRVKVQGKLSILLKDKYYAYIILMFVQRGSQLMINEIYNTIKSQPLLILNAKYFGFLLSKIPDQNDGKLKGFVHQLLVEVPISIFRKLVLKGSKDLFCMIQYILLTTVDLNSKLRCKNKLLNIIKMGQGMTPTIRHQKI